MPKAAGFRSGKEKRETWRSWWWAVVLHRAEAVVIAIAEAKTR